ncbi:MAG: transcription termination/antitermination protein NusG [candidate division KSB1 bacterium]|nr:transcription termination/antitermination protein NusG [candidate division KSB1 bacterium]
MDAAPERVAADSEELKWYAVHVLSGHERKVKAYLDNEIDKSGLRHKIKEVLLPAEQVTEMRQGKKRTRNRIFFTGYLFLHMVLDKETQHLVLNTPGITNFVGSKAKPEPLRPDEIDRILGRVDESRAKERIHVPFRVGDAIKVIDGPFTDFTGVVQEIYEDKNKLRVMVSIFGRSTPVELDFLQVELES